MNEHETRHYIISVTAADRIGIIHDLTRTISAMGGDLADVRQQVLRGYFSMILCVSFPGHLQEEEIREALVNIDPEHPFEISIRPAPALSSSDQVPANSYVLTARGSDRIGFVALVSGFCADNQVNIVDLSTTGRDETYTMILLVDLSNAPPVETLRSRLEQFSNEHGLSLLLQHLDIFKATNEIRMI